MKHTVILALVLSASSVVFAQSMDMKNMDMKNMDMKNMDMKNMDMKNMDMKKDEGMTKDMEKKQSSGKAHKAVATVKKVDPAARKVTLAHGPVKSLNWPAMTMNFSVDDDALFDKLGVDKKVNIEFIKKGSDYVVTAVK